MIKSDQISVVLQGPIKGANGESRALTAESIRSIRNLLPKCQIIISTWEGEDTTQLPHNAIDSIVFSKDPGGQFRADGVRFNINRQIISTKSGIARSDRQYTLKLRSDTILISDRFLCFWEKFPQRNPACKYFQNRILAPELYFRSPVRSPFACLFHISDLCQFGNTFDLQKLWECPLISDELASAIGEPKPWPTIRRFEMMPGKYTEEQYLWISFLKRQGLDVDLQWIYDVDSRNAFLSELSIVNNFAILTVEDMGIALPPHVFNFAPRSVYSHLDWVELLAVYCPSDRECIIAQESAIVRNAEILAAFRNRTGST